MRTTSTVSIASKVGKFSKFSWANSQLLFWDCEGQILAIFQDLGKSHMELGNNFILGRRLDCAINVSEIGAET